METQHNPQYYYDCNNCKFNWCCGFTCGCALKLTMKLPSPPEEIKIAVINARVAAGLTDWTIADKDNLL